MPSIKGTMVPTGITSSNAEGGEISIRVDYHGHEVGLYSIADGVNWRPRDFDRLIEKLVEVRDAMQKEGLLT